MVDTGIKGIEKLEPTRRQFVEQQYQRYGFEVAQQAYNVSFFSQKLEAAKQRGDEGDIRRYEREAGKANIQFQRKRDQASGASVPPEQIRRERQQIAIQRQQEGKELTPAQKKALPKTTETELESGTVLVSQRIAGQAPPKRPSRVVVSEIREKDTGKLVQVGGIYNTYEQAQTRLEQPNYVSLPRGAVVVGKGEAKTVILPKQRGIPKEDQLKTVPSGVGTIISEKIRSIPVVKGAIDINRRISEGPVGGYFKKAAITYETLGETFEKRGKETVGVQRIGFKVLESGSRFTSGVQRFVSEQPLAIPGLYIASVPVGAGLTKVAATRLGGPVVKVAGVGLTGLFAVGVTSAVISAPTKQQKYDVIAKETSKVIAISSGLIRGSRLLGTKIKIETVTRRGPKATLGKTVGGVKSLKRVDSGVEFQRSVFKKTFKTVGETAQPISVTKGYLKTSGKTFKLRAVTVGKTTTGVLKTRGYDVFFREKGGFLYSRIVSSSGRVVKQVRTPAPPEILPQLKFKSSSRVATQQLSKPGGIAIGAKVSDTPFYSKRLTRTIFKSTFAGRQVERVGLRDVSKIFKGFTVSKTLQQDIAFPQKEVITIDGSKIFTFRQADIKFSVKPTFKPNIAKYLSETVRVGKETAIRPIREVILRPKLFTERTTKPITRTVLQYSESQVKLPKLKPIIGKKGQILYKTGSRVGIQTEIPKQPKLDIQKPVLSVRSLKNIAGVVPVSRPVVLPFSIPRSISQPKLIPVGRTRAFIRPRARIEPEVKIKPFVRVKVPVISRIKIRPEIVVRPRTRTRTTARTRTNVQSLVKVKVPTPSLGGPSSAAPIPIIPLLPTPTIPGLPRLMFGLEEERKKKKGRRSKRRLQYQSSLVARALNIRGKKPKTITGFGIRPIVGR